jgi:O-antigen/teichoic acid export membrane protein
MTSQAAAVDTSVLEVPPARSRALSGAGLLSAAMVLSGLLTYLFHVLAARTLGPEAYGRIAVLWAAMFIAAVVLFRPLEQTAARMIADRRARGEEARTVLRSVAAICAVLVLAALTGLLVGWGPVSDRLFLGDDTLMGLLMAGIAIYALAYLVRGWMGGARWFSGYGLGLIADAVARFALALPLVVVASTNLAAVAIVAAGLAGVLVPLIVGRRVLRNVLVGTEGTSFRAASALAFAAPASLIAAADQLLVNGGPLLVALGGSAGAATTAGVVFAATMLVRAPVYVFQGLAASLLPNLTHLQATQDSERFRRGVVTTAGFLLGGGALIAGFAALAGPEAMRLLYGAGFDAGRGELVLLGAGVGCYLAATTFSQALLALDRGRSAALGWVLAACSFVALYVALPGDELTRISISFFLAALVDLAVLGPALFRGTRA